MVAIAGKVNQSITGTVRATPVSPFIDYSQSPTVLVSLPIEAAITNGSFTITVPQSQFLAPVITVVTEGIPYKWELFQTVSTFTFYFLDGSVYSGATHLYTDSIYYTGSVHDATSKRLDRVATTTSTAFQNPFYAIAPNSSTTVDFSTLIAISAEKPYLDISAYRISELLTTVSTYRDRISAKFNVRGNYATNTYYVLNDLVAYNGSSYLWINATSAQNVAPPASGSDSNWLQIAAKGAAGGTGAQIVGYSSSWSGSSEAASRGDVYQGISSIPNPDLSNYLTVSAGLPRANAVMTGTSKRATLTYPVASADKATEIPTAQYVEDAIAALAVSNRLPTPLIFARRSSVLTLGQDVRSTVVWNPRVIYTDSLLNSSGVITIQDAGNYLFYLSLQASITGNYQSSQGQVQIRFRGILYNSGASVDAGDFFNYCYGATQATFQNKQQGFRLETGLSVGTTLTIDAATQVSGASSVISSSQIDGTQANNFFMMWRVA